MGDQREADRGLTVPGNEGSPLANTEVHRLHSEYVRDDFKIFVGHCPGRGEEAPAVVYLGDANGFFGGAVDAIRLMQLSAHLPPMLVVGIGYPVGTIDETDTQRTRDFTPTVDPEFGRIFPDQQTMGGAPRLLAFIRDELQPWVHANYRADPDRSTFFGHSFGGLFATYVLLTKPDTFTRYGIGSPSLWWHRRNVLDLEAAYAAAHSDLRAKVYFSIGVRETHEGRQTEASRLPADEARIAGLWYIDMVADMQQMVAALDSRDYPSLELASAVFADEFHITVPFLNLTRSLRYLFDAPR
jgi:predicted alpha/beta superfamily hydrolase